MGGLSATAFTGVSAVVMSPIVARLSTKVDPRGLVFLGIFWLGLASLLRVHWNSGAGFSGRWPSRSFFRASARPSSSFR